jgi:RHS repeat-associated protein
VGVTKLVVDAFGRSTAIYVADPNGRGGSLALGAYGTRTVSATTFTYSATSVTTITDQGTQRIEDKNAIGELVRVTDAAGATLVQQRDAFGNLVKTKDALGNAVLMAYDYRGRKLQLQDPDTGTWNYTVNSLGEVTSQQSPKELAQATSTTFQYDAAGRLRQRTEPEYVTAWQYDKNADGSSCMGASTSLGKGKLCQSSTSAGLSRQFVYDSLGRPSSARTNVSGGPSFAVGQTYDASTGRLSTKTYPTGLKVGYSYTASRGYLEKLLLLTSATVSPLPNAQGQTASSGSVASTLWQGLVASAWGTTEQQVFGNGVTTTAKVEAGTGRVTDLNAGTSNTVLSQHYTWDSLSNLVGRADANGDGNTGAVSESFTYGDSLNRLTSYTVSAPSIPGLSRTVNLQYNALGMLLYKSDVGNFTYPTQAGGVGTRPHAVQSVAGAYTATYGFDANGNVTSATAGKYRSVSYTSFNLPDGSTGLQGASSSPRYTWQYDEGHARIRETRVDGSGTRTTWYLHPDNVGGLGFESEIAPSGAVSNRHFLTVGGQVIGVLVNTAALPTLAGGQTAPTDLGTIALVKVEYWHKDQLGSLISTTDHAGAVTARYAYDPFGKRRYSNGSYDAAGNLVVDWSPTLNAGTARGFTGQEDLDDIGVVHMNGRLFDPMLGVYMQPNPAIGAPGDMQTYNRYGYCENNPLTCTDPSGMQGVHAVRSAGAVAMFARESTLMPASSFIGTAATDFAFSGTPWPVIVPKYAQATSGAFAPQNYDDFVKTPAYAAIVKAGKDPAYVWSQMCPTCHATGSAEQDWAMSQPNLDYIQGTARVVDKWGDTVSADTLRAGGYFLGGMGQNEFWIPPAQNGANSTGADPGRPLTANEITEAKKEYGDKIDYSKVKVYSSKWMPFQGDLVAMTPMGDIYFPAAAGCSDLTACVIAVDGGQVSTLSTYIHEMGHVEQYQRGVNVMLSALPLQILYYSSFGFYNPYISRDQYYNIPSPDGLNVESQANWHMHNYCVNTGKC